MKVKTVELSGFGMYSGYEFVCQKALWAGVEYLAKVDYPEKILDKTQEFTNVYGIAITPDSAKELEEVWSKLDKTHFGGWTGAQHQAVVGHLRMIAKKGVKGWLEEFKDDPNRVYELDLDGIDKELEARLKE